MRCSSRHTTTSTQLVLMRWNHNSCKLKHAQACFYYDQVIWLPLSHAMNSFRELHSHAAYTPMDYKYFPDMLFAILHTMLCLIFIYWRYKLTAAMPITLQVHFIIPEIISPHWKIFKIKSHRCYCSLYLMPCSNLMYNEPFLRSDLMFTLCHHKCSKFWW